MKRASAVALVGLVGLTVGLYPIAGSAALALAVAVALAFGRRVGVVVLIVALVAAQAGLRIDQAPPRGVQERPR